MFVVYTGDTILQNKRHNQTLYKIGGHADSHWLSPKYNCSSDFLPLLIPVEIFWILLTVISFGTCTSGLTSTSNGLVVVLTTFRVPDKGRKCVSSLVWTKTFSEVSRILYYLFGHYLFVLIVTVSGKVNCFQKMIFFRNSRPIPVKHRCLLLLFPCHFLNRLIGVKEPPTGVGSTRWRGTGVWHIDLTVECPTGSCVTEVFCTSTCFYYQSIKRKINRRLICEFRCDERRLLWIDKARAK